MKPSLRLAAVAALASAACRTVTLVAEPGVVAERAPRYERSLPFGFWGLAGEHEIDVDRVCRGSRPARLQTQSTFTDGLAAAFTLGLYKPRTARVWCAAGEE